MVAIEASTGTLRWSSESIREAFVEISNVDGVAMHPPGRVLIPLSDFVPLGIDDVDEGVTVRADSVNFAFG